MAQPEREIRGLRNDLRELCAALAGRAEEAKAVAALTRSAVEAGTAQVAVVHEDLSASSPGVPVSLIGQTAVLETSQAGGGAGGEAVTVSNLEGVENAVLQDAETVNAGLWGIAGLFAGFLLLAVIFKLVRP